MHTFECAETVILTSDYYYLVHCSDAVSIFFQEGEHKNMLFIVAHFYVITIISVNMYTRIQYGNKAKIHLLR